MATTIKHTVLTQQTLQRTLRLTTTIIKTTSRHLEVAFLHSLKTKHNNDTLANFKITSKRYRQLMDRALRARHITVNGVAANSRQHMCQTGDKLQITIDFPEACEQDCLNYIKTMLLKKEQEVIKMKAAAEKLPSSTSAAAIATILLKRNASLTLEERDLKRARKQCAKQLKKKVKQMKRSQGDVPAVNGCNGYNGYANDDLATLAMAIVKNIVTSMGVHQVNRKARRQAGNLLLKSMTKLNEGSKVTALHGIQSDEALLGYSSLKFTKRALLVYRSLRLINEKNSTTHWTTLMNVRNVVSFGAGPGNDMLGWLIFRRVMSGRKKGKSVAKSGQQSSSSSSSSSSTSSSSSSSSNSSRVIRILLTDVVDSWKCVTDKLIDIIQQEQNATGCWWSPQESSLSSNTPSSNSDSIDGIIDIQQTVLDITHPTAVDSLYQHMNVSGMRNTSNTSDTPATTLFLLSYLLTEVKGQWLSFFNTLYENAQNGSCFYIAEPVPTQQLILIASHANWVRGVDFVWVDSSTFATTDNGGAMEMSMARVGAAVLLVFK
jgi:hypothetical protein